ncbi:hypothetical protein FPZ43_11780 [Mucilaginibacter pallidiroseus]|uniref:Uncharacterized protein n=1 Tax=Mucilaginibacter pallidiroseus TaxID=2599295 RepID=A0A563UC32_9SPHI|nr:hypothetical protein [Mucilaginibacter pallidiroseus]TWR28938.1 hypothetical protein FPZ43_11780 [Mucilaginibacter pallidiroseus]
MKTQSNFNAITDADKRGDDWNATYQDSTDNTVPAEALPDDVSETTITTNKGLSGTEETRGDDWDSTYKETNIESGTGPDDIIQTDVDEDDREDNTQSSL